MNLTDIGGKKKTHTFLLALRILSIIISQEVRAVRTTNGSVGPSDNQQVLLSHPEMHSVVSPPPSHPPVAAAAAPRHRLPHRQHSRHSTGRSTGRQEGGAAAPQSVIAGGGGVGGAVQWERERLGFTLKFGKRE